LSNSVCDCDWTPPSKKTPLKAVGREVEEGAKKKVNEPRDYVVAQGEREGGVT